MSRLHKLALASLSLSDLLMKTLAILNYLPILCVPRMLDRDEGTSLPTLTDLSLNSWPSS